LASCETFQRFPANNFLTADGQVTQMETEGFFGRKEAQIAQKGKENCLTAEYANFVFNPETKSGALHLQGAQCLCC
jgi:hypothetical protein